MAIGTSNNDPVRALGAPTPPMRSTVHSTNVTVHHENIHKASREQPMSPFVIVFNAPESFEAYKLIQQARLKFVNIVAFSGSQFPCTIGVPFECWDELAGRIYRQCRRVYMLSSATEGFVDTSGNSLVDMLASPQFTINNPFDPLVVETTTNSAQRSSINGHASGPVILTLEGNRFNYAREAYFDFSVLQYSGHIDSIQDNPQITRLVELACFNALAELFEEGEWKLEDAPDFVRICAGIVKTSRYTNFLDFSSRVISDVKDLVHRYVFSGNNFVAYDHILRIARGIAISEELQNVPFALERWQQLFYSADLNISEKVRQFELEMLSFQIRNDGLPV